MILSSFISLDRGIKFSNVEKAKENLCEIDIKKYNSFIKEDDRMLFLTARILLERLFWKFSNSFCMKDLNYSPLGKPYYRDPFHLSIAHSGKYCAAAISDFGPVGIDIQAIQNIEIGDYDFVLDESEKEFLQSKNSDEQLKFFFQRWSVLEAIMKADGRGFHLDPGLIQKKDGGYVLTDNNKNYFATFAPDVDGYVLALVGSSKDEPVNWLSF